MKVKPTRMELIALKRRLKLAEKAYDLLLDKENELVSELFNTLREYSTVYRRVMEALRKIDRGISLSEVEVGRLETERLLSMRKPCYEVDARPLNLMGLRLVQLGLRKIREPVKVTNLISSPVSFILAEEEAMKTAEEFMKLIELAYKMENLSKEIAKVRRRVNALNYRLIPEIKRNIALIEMALEEREREELFRLRKIIEIRETAKSA